MIPAITPQIAMRKTRSQSPPQRTQRRPVSQMHAAIASSSITPYMWIVNGPSLYTPVGGEGIEASRDSALIERSFCPLRRLQEDLKRELGRAAALEQVDGRVQVDVEARREARGVHRVVARAHQQLGPPALHALQLGLEHFV